MRAFAVAAILAMALMGSASAQEGAAQPAAYSRLDMFALGHGGVNRSIGLYVPRSYQPGHPAPLIVALHGRFSSAQAMHALDHLAAVAEQRGAILLYPQNSGPYWNDGGFAALGRHETPADDVGFVTAALAAVGEDYAIDRGHLYLVGYDNGGAMAYDLACRGAVHFAGVAVVSALMWDYAEQACAGAQATPMLIMHGERDELFPTEGLAPEGGRTARMLSASGTLGVWRRINGCGPDSHGAYANCSGAPLAYVSVSGGDHDWFRTGARYQLNRQGVDAAAVINQFFFNRGSFTPPNGGNAGRARSWIVYVPPSYNPARPTPVVLLLHGRPSSAPAMAAITQMNAVADRHGFIVVYPQGLDNEWNAYFDLVRQPALAPQDDIAFLKTLTEDLSVDLNIDRRRMYVGGFSNGGFMTLRLACSAGNYFAAFASVGAELYTQLTTRCQGERGPIILMHGTADPSIPYNGVLVQTASGARVPTGGSGTFGGANMGGGMGGGMNGGMSGGGMSGGFGIGGGGPSGPTRISLSAFETASFFTRRNHCDVAGTRIVYPESGRSPGTHVTRFAPRNCADGDDVAIYVIEGGGHTWPGVPGVLEGLGPVNQDINASEEIWNFFASHSLAADPR